MSNPLTASAWLQRYRTRISRIAWFAVIGYLFGYLRIPVVPFDSTLGIVGLLVVTLGLAVRSLSAGMLQKNAVLATDGIYAIVRNPLYFGSLLLLSGVNILIFHWLMALTSLLLFVVIYASTILREESGLAHSYGEQWQAFKRTTPRLFPNLLKLGELRHSTWSGSQWYKNHEHNTILAAIAIVAALYLYGRYIAING